MQAGHFSSTVASFVLEVRAYLLLVGTVSGYACYTIDSTRQAGAKEAQSAQQRLCKLEWPAFNDE